MRCLVQRVRQAEVTVHGRVAGSIGTGLAVLVGFTHHDGPPEIAWMADKLVHLRVFEHQERTMTKSLLDIQGEMLVVSQFTLYAEVRRGRRPDFSSALAKDEAEPLYARFLETLSAYTLKLQAGVFGGDMQLSVINWGPVTLLLERPPDLKFKGENIPAH